MPRAFYTEQKDLSQTELDIPVTHQHTEAPELLDKQFVDGQKVNRASFLESKLQTVRESLYQDVTIAGAEWNNVKAATANEWNNLINTVTSVYDPRDKFLPNFNYALTIMLSGSILANRSSLPVRFLTPVVFGATAFKFFLPGTFDNTTNAVKNWEAREHPELLGFQRSLKAGVTDVETTLSLWRAQGEQQLIDWVHQLRTAGAVKKDT